MTDALIKFRDLEWTNPGPGVRFKEYIRGEQKVRLVEFSEGFIEEDWCTKGHIGYVLEGSMKIDFDGDVVSFEVGDGLWIEEGETQKHKVLIGEHGSVLLILFERP